MWANFWLEIYNLVQILVNKFSVDKWQEFHFIGFNFIDFQLIGLHLTGLKLIYWNKKLAHFNGLPFFIAVGMNWVLWEL